ncbi:MAG TPA: DUF2171 domain-containing protein, partial [Allosphingosinicella sp.]|nr:DUF2171 domain-containing protein [Allosphingosinicella sp.]
MAYDERDDRRRRGWGRESQWRGDPSFGGGWGNQLSRPHRLDDRGFSGPGDNPDFGADLTSGGYGYGPGYDPDFSGGPRFDRADAGGIGTHGAHAIASPSGPAYGFGQSGILRRHDPHYAEWRQREIDALDRDYDDYRREHQSRFDREFGAWRETRGRQREAVGKVSEHMEVVGSDGAHVGTVDCTRGDSIVLTRSDEAAGGVHHRIPCAWVESVEDKVVLNLAGEEARERWRVEDRSR